MKVITRMELQKGMELGEDVEYQGSVLYKAGSIVNEHMIDRINRYGIMCVTIKEDVDYAETHFEKIRFDKKFQDFVIQYAECLDQYKAYMVKYIKEKQPIPSKDLLSLFHLCRQKIDYPAQLLDFLYNMMPNEDELTYTQSFNSALLCGIFSEWLDLSEDEKNIFILCGFYYDIGKWNIPNNILWKPGKLTEEEFAIVKKHPVLSYAILRNDSTLDNHIINAAISHHERVDGSGYPYHMVGEKIDIYARYMAIVDTYIAMASPRSFRGAFTPLQIVGSFEDSRIKYDTKILDRIIVRIAEAQIGSTVKLNDNTEWEVAAFLPGSYSKPLLRGKNGETINLRDFPDLKIVKMV